MFYEANEISKLITCMHCKHVFDDPRILDCGESMCKDCIDSNSTDDIFGKKNEIINCIICKGTHYIPEKGFPKNHVLAKLIKIKASEVSRGPVARELDLKLNEIHAKAETLELNLRTGIEKIREKCNCVRSDVDSVTENWHQLVNAYHEQFFTNINAYEEECIQKYKERFVENNDTVYTPFIVSTNVFYEKWRDYLKKFQIDDTEMARPLSEARDLLKDLDTKTKQLRCQTFIGRLLKFEENETKLEATNIGTISYENLKYFSRLDAMQSLDLRSMLSELNLDARIVIEILSDECFAIAYHTTSNNVNMLTVNRAGTILAQQNSIIPPVGAFALTTQDLKLFKAGNNIYLYNYSYCANGNNMYNLKCYGAAVLNLIANINLTGVFKDFIGYDQQIFGLACQNASFGMLSVYNLNLGITQNLGQNSPALPYYFAPNVTKLRVNREFYFLLDTSTDIKIMSRSNGLVAKTFRINVNDFCLDLEMTILAYDGSTKKLLFFDLEGKTEIEHVVENAPDNNFLIGAANEELIFFDPDLVALNY